MPSNTLYEMITNRYIFNLTVDGEAKDLTRGELMSYVRQHDPELRAAGLPGTLQSLWQGRPDPRANLPDPGARLAQRANLTAKIRKADVGS